MGRDAEEGRKSALRSAKLVPWVAALLGLVLETSAQPVITMQMLEIVFDPYGGADLTHACTLVGEDGWEGMVNFTYELGLQHVFKNPEDLVDWGTKINVKTEGCRSSPSFDFRRDKVVVTVQVLDGSPTCEIVIHMHLVDVVEETRQQSFPLLIMGGARRRFSMVTPRSNLNVKETRVFIHLPAGQHALNYLPTSNVTVLPGRDGGSIFWTFEGESAQEARVYVESGSKGKIGSLMILILVLAILGVILAAFRFFLVVYEESLTY